MFADLLKYKEKSFYEEHPTIKFTTDKEEAEYVLSAKKASIYYTGKTANEILHSITVSAFIFLVSLIAIRKRK